MRYFIQNHNSKILLLILFAICIYCNRKEPPTQVDPAEPELIEEDRTVYFVKTRAGVYFRAEPNVKAKKLAIIPFGTKLTGSLSKGSAVTIDKKTGYWLKFKFAGKLGWAFSGYLSQDNLPQLLTDFDRLQHKYCTKEEHILACARGIERKLISEHPDLAINRQKKQLIIPLPGAKSVKFTDVDEPDSDKSILYNVGGIYPPIIVIYELLYEGDSFTGIDLRSGAEVHLLREPIFSPDHVRFLTFNSCSEPGYCDVGLTIHRVTDTTTVNEFKIKKQDVLFAEWLSDIQIEITLPPTEKSDKPRKQKLSLRDGKWL